MTKIDFETIKKYSCKNEYYFKTNQNVFGVTDRVFNKSKKLVFYVKETDRLMILRNSQ